MSCVSTSPLKYLGENPRFHGHLGHDGSFEEKESNACCRTTLTRARPCTSALDSQEDDCFIQPCDAAGWSLS